MRRQAERARRRGLDWLASALACLAALVVVHWSLPSAAVTGGEAGVGSDAPAASAPLLGQRELGRAAGPESQRLKTPGDPAGGAAAVLGGLGAALPRAGTAAAPAVAAAAVRATPPGNGFDARAPPRPA